MTKYILSILLLFILIACKEDTTEPNTNVVDLDPTYYYKFDVKTKYSEKMKVTGSKNGLISYIKDCEWAEVVETNENYSVWIKNCERNPINTEVTVNFDLELRTPAMITEGDLIKSKNITIIYYLNENWIDQAGNPNAEDVYKQFKEYTDRMKAAGQLLPFVQKLATYNYPQFKTYIDIVFSFLEDIMNEGEKQEHKAEAVIVGAETFAVLREWIKEIEK